MKCPYCAKKNCDPDYVKNYAETYGDQVSNFECKYCHKVIKVGLSRVVKVDFIRKTDEESDWPKGG